MPPNLPIDVLRSFVAIVDAGSMLKAAERVFLTQSALSLQVKRLEELLQAPLFSREGRRLVLTSAGDAFLGYARRLLALNDEAVRTVAGAGLNGPLRIGMVQDYAETLLSGALAQFARLHPETMLQARVGGTLELLDALEQTQIDLVLGYADASAEPALRRDPMLWIGDPRLNEGDVLPLAVLEKPCRFREAGLRALDQGGQRYRIALETPNLSTLRAGVQAGLGVTCRTPMFARSVDLSQIAGLPELPHVVTALWQSAASSDAQRRLAGLLTAVVAESGG